MDSYIWQNKEWPKLSFKSSKIIEELGQARKAQGKILAQGDFIGLEAQSDIVVEEAFTTSAIEGEQLDRKTIRSSVARRLGLPTAGLPTEQRSVDGLVEMLMDATQNHHSDLSESRLHGWNAALFPTGFSGIHKINVGSWRKGKEPMQVISGPIGREEVHYEAPPAKDVPKEIKQFLKWWRNPGGLDGLLRAGMAHFWFVTIHPYEDGNGRIARAITDMALAQDERTGRRLYSLSSQIVSERDAYYNILESSEKGNCDITEWLKWFLTMFVRSIENSQEIIKKALFIVKFWQTHSQSNLNERQIKIVQRLLEAEPEGFKGRITNRKYVTITKVSSETAKRDLSDLEKKGLIKRSKEKGRSVSYLLSTNLSNHS